MIAVPGIDSIQTEISPVIVLRVGHVTKKERGTLESCLNLQIYERRYVKSVEHYRYVRIGELDV